MRKVIVATIVAFSISGCNYNSLKETNYKECLDMYDELQSNNFFIGVSKEDTCSCIAERQTDFMLDEVRYTDLYLYSNFKKEFQRMSDQYFTVAMYECNNELINKE